METKNIIEIMLLSYIKNLDELKDKLGNSYEEYKSVFELSLLFLKQERRFNEISNMDYKEFSLCTLEYKKLGVSLNETTRKLKALVLEIEKKKLINLQESVPQLKDYLYKVSTNKSFEESLNLHNAIDAITLVLKDTSFYTDEICNDINNSLGYELFLPELNGIEKKIVSRQFYEYDNRIDFEIHLKKMYMITKVYQMYGDEGVKRLLSINSFVYTQKDELQELLENYLRGRLPNKEFYSSFFRNKFPFEFSVKEDTDLFITLFDYDKIKSDDFNEKEAVNLLLEVINLDGMFKELTDEEVAALLYSYKNVNNTFSDIISSKDKYSFKDLTNIVNLINRRKKEGYDKNMLLKLINDITSKKIPLSLEEKSTKKL